MKDGAGGDICVEIVEAIARAEDKRPRELDFVLDDHVDTDALDMLCASGREPWELTFGVPGHEVVVRNGDSIAVDGESFSAGG